MWPLLTQQTATETATAIASTDVSSPELTAVFATGFVLLGALLLLARLRR